MKLCEAYFLNRFNSATLRGAAERAARQERADLFEASSRIPIDLEQIAGLRGISVVAKVDVPGCEEGRLLPTKHGFFVQLKSTSSQTRKRFSLAHELGHTLFYKDEGRGPRHQVAVLSSDEILAEERICNLFAQSLLMPAVNLREELGPIPANAPWQLLDLLERAARKFRVSLHALIVRFSTVRPESPPYLVTYHRFRENQVTGKDPTLRLDAYTQLGPLRKVWMWRNRSVTGINLRSVAALFDAWMLQRQEPGNLSGGRYVWNPTGTVLRAASAGEQCLHEDIEVSILNDGHWRKQCIRMVVASRLYAPPGASERAAYIVSVLMPEN